MSNKDGVIKELKALYERIQAAPDYDALCVIAIQEMRNDDALAGEDCQHARAIMSDYVSELCFDYGIPCGLVMPIDLS